VHNDNHLPWPEIHGHKRSTSKFPVVAVQTVERVQREADVGRQPALVVRLAILADRLGCQQVTGDQVVHWIEAMAIRK